MPDEFDYDVAFSFLAQDENVANQLNDALSGRVQAFLYSEQQKQLAGTDGENTFNAVFGRKSRSVAILYRDAWGSNSLDSHRRNSDSEPCSRRGV